MNILIVGGFGMRTLDGEPYWTLGARLTANGHTVRLKECEQTGQAAKVASEDFLWADAICAYSYGMASQLGLSTDRTTPLKLLIIVAGVPDVWSLQWYGQVWTLPEYILKARDFQVQAVPVSEYIRNRAPVGSTLATRCPPPNATSTSTAIPWCPDSRVPSTNTPTSKTPRRSWMRFMICSSPRVDRRAMINDLHTDPGAIQGECPDRQ